MHHVIHNYKQSTKNTTLLMTLPLIVFFLVLMAYVLAYGIAPKNIGSPQTKGVSTTYQER